AAASALARRHSRRQRIAEVIQAVVAVAIAVPARDRLLQRGDGLGAVDVADGAFGGAAGDPVRDRLQQVFEHLRIATAGRIGAGGALVALDGAVPPADMRASVV